MKPEELYEIIRKALEEGVSLDISTLVLLGILALLGGFLGSYLRTKGKNLATKEDIEAITKKIESIKAEYATQLELLAQEHRIFLKREEQRHDLSVAALEKRLAAHQEAYALWWNLMGNATNRGKVGDTVMKCQEWWVHNSLYLSSEARKAFSDAYHAAILHPNLLDSHSNADKIEDNWKTIVGAGEVLLKAVSLPSWGEDEFKPIEDKSAPKSGY